MKFNEALNIALSKGYVNVVQNYLKEIDEDNYFFDEDLQSIIKISNNEKLKILRLFKSENITPIEVNVDIKYNETYNISRKTIDEILQFVDDVASDTEYNYQWKDPEFYLHLLDLIKKD